MISSTQNCPRTIANLFPVQGALPAIAEDQPGATVMRSHVTIVSKEPCNMHSFFLGKTWACSACRSSSIAHRILFWLSGSQTFSENTGKWETLPSITIIHNHIPMAVHSKYNWVQLSICFRPLQIAEALHTQFCNFCLFARLGARSRENLGHSSTSSTLREVERFRCESHQSWFTKNEMQTKSHAKYNAFFALRSKVVSSISHDVVGTSVDSFRPSQENWRRDGPCNNYTLSSSKCRANFWYECNLWRRRGKRGSNTQFMSWSMCVRALPARVVASLHLYNSYFVGQKIDRTSRTSNYHPLSHIIPPRTSKFNDYFRYLNQRVLICDYHINIWMVIFVLLSTKNIQCGKRNNKTSVKPTIWASFHIIPNGGIPNNKPLSGMVYRIGFTLLCIYTVYTYIDCHRFCSTFLVLDW